MPVHRLADMTWHEVRDLDRARAVAVLPVGAVEAHGPHLPLSTDVIIAEAMARSCGESLAGDGIDTVVLPPLWYTAAGFAEGFPGTIGVDADTVTALVRQIAASLGAQGFRILAVANAHLDPAHLGAMRAAEAAGATGAAGAADLAMDSPGPSREQRDPAADPTAPPPARVVFLDLTRRAAAERLTDEFRTGACHAGRFEGSVVRAEAPGLYREDVAAGLQPNPASLSSAIREGRTTFPEAGGGDAYFGWPAEATAEEGRATVAELGRMLAEAVRDARGSDRGAPPASRGSR